MAWIESHQALEKHPKILQLSTMMDWNLNETLGIMHRFWWWTLDYAPTGNLQGIDPLGLAKGLHLSDKDSTLFMPALLETHLVCRLTRTRLPWRVHDWIEYAGRFLRDTKFRHTPEKYAQVVEFYKLPCTKSQPIVSRHCSGKGVNRPDKSAVPNLPNQPTNLPDSDGFDLAWEAYPRKVGKEPARKAWIKTASVRPQMDVLIEAITRQKQSPQWLKDDGQYIPHFSTWLNQQRWNDDFTKPVSPQVKCLWSNDGPCPSYAESGSRYCIEHRQIIKRAQERKDTVMRVM